MKKFIQRCLAALAIVIIINAIALVVLLYLSPSFKKVNESSGFKNKNYELLVFGNSLAMDGVDTEYLTKRGFNSYNFAIGGCHISSCVIQLDHYLKNNKKPKAILLVLSSATGRSFLNKVTFVNPEIEFFFHPTFENSVLNPPAVKFRWLFAELIKIIVSKDHRHSTVVQGQWRSPKVIPDVSVYKNTSNTIFNYKDPYLSQLVERCDREGIKVIVTEYPAANDLRNRFPYVYEVNTLNGRKMKVYNLNNYDVSSEFIDSEKDWLAPNHMNKNGAVKITDYLVEHCLKEEFKNLASNTKQQ